MLYVAGLLSVFGPKGVPYVIQCLGVAAWVALLTAMWRLMRVLGADRSPALLLVGVVGLMPGSARNAVMGMENV